VEVLLPNTGACPALAALDDAMFASAGWLKFKATIDDLTAELMEILDTPNTTTWGSNGNLNAYFDNFNTLQCTKQALPCSKANPSKCITQSMADQVYAAGSFYYQYKYGLYKQQTRSQIGIGGLLNLIDGNFAAATEGTATKLSYYSGHDDTIAALLGAFNQTDFLWPPYASHISHELWYDDSAAMYLVRMMYNGQVIPMDTCVTYNTDGVCTLAEWKTYTKKITPSANNINDLCSASSVVVDTPTVQQIPAQTHGAAADKPPLSERTVLDLKKHKNQYKRATEL
jgi:hypothetical protein